jgi:hypothetical protein
VSGNQTLPRSRTLKRTQKGREDEWTGRGRPAVNGIELRNLCICRILPKVCSHLKATSVTAFWRAIIEEPAVRQRVCTIVSTGVTKQVKIKLAPDTVAADRR